MGGGEAVAPNLDLDGAMRAVWFGTKIRIEATIEAELYREIQKIILEERKLAEQRNYPEVPISHVVEMLLRRGVRGYREEQRAK